MPPPTDLFEPATLSIPELEFTLQHLGESPAVAFADPAPRGVNPAAVTPLLAKLCELEELQTVKNRPWAGYDQVRDSIIRFLAWQDRCRQIARAGGPRHPSMYVFDGGIARRGAIGTDSASMVRSEILDDGTRKKFTVDLLSPRQAAGMSSTAAALMPWLKDVVDPDVPSLDAVQEDVKRGLLTCSICDHIVKFDPAPEKGSRPYNMARGHMNRHLRTAKTDVARHQALRARLFA